MADPPCRAPKWWYGIAVAAILALIGGYLIGVFRRRGPLTAPAPLATWPWPHAVVTSPHNGVTVWTDRSSPDGTILRLIRFDFAKNPHLRFAIYDQATPAQETSSQAPHPPPRRGTPFAPFLEERAGERWTPRDDGVDYWPMGVAQATAHLNERGEGRVIAACNGLFFGTEARVDTPNGVAYHVAATVENGVARYNVGNYRWTFGVKYNHGLPSFETLHMPDRQTMAKSFTFASGGAQCLIRDGLPLRLRPFPGPDAPVEKQPVPSTPDEAGHIPVVDYIKTSRVSFGWSRDSTRFYLLFVRQIGTEAGSILAFRMRGMGSTAESRSRMLARGGWDIADEQRFWRRLGAWGAVNSDGGEVAQLSLAEPDGKYGIFPAQWATPTEEIDDVDPSTEAKTLPAGGSLMYFYVYDRSDKTALLRR